MDFWTLDFGTQMLLVLFAVGFSMLFFIPLSMPLGILWSPFGALICALIARRRALPVKYYAGMGAWHSALLLLPWIYLVLRMTGRTVSRGWISFGYFILYAVWFIGSVCVMAIFVIGIFVDRPDSLILWAFMMWLIVILFAANVYMWISSVRAMSGGRMAPKDGQEADHGIIPDQFYLRPFLYAFIAFCIEFALIPLTMFLYGDG